MITKDHIKTSIRQFNINELFRILRESAPEEFLMCVNPFNDSIIFYFPYYKIDVFGHDLNEYKCLWQIIGYVLTEISKRCVFTPVECAEERLKPKTSF